MGSSPYMIPALKLTTSENQMEPESLLALVSATPTTLQRNLPICGTAGVDTQCPLLGLKSF